jgi:hypothetical protein
MDGSRRPQPFHGLSFRLTSVAHARTRAWLLHIRDRMALVAWLPFVLSIAVAFVSALAFVHVSNGRQLSLPHLGHRTQNRLAHTRPFGEKMRTEIDTSLMITLGLGFIFLWLIGTFAFVHAFW